MGLFGALLFVLVVGVACSGAVPCGQFSASHDFSHHDSGKLNVKWKPLEISNPKVTGYSWAVISDELWTPALLQNDCRNSPGFAGIPDVADWTSYSSRATGASILLKAEPNVGYISIVKASLEDGSDVFVSTHVATAEKDEDKVDSLDFLSKSEEPTLVRDATAEHRTLKRHKRQVAEVEQVQAAPLFPSGSTCPIENAWRCEQSRRTVGDYLTEVYGPARFLGSSEDVYRQVPLDQFGRILTSDEVESFSSVTVSSSSDGGISLGALLGIIFGVTGFIILLALILIVLTILVVVLLSRGSGSGTFRSTNIEEF